MFKKFKINKLFQKAKDSYNNNDFDLALKYLNELLEITYCEDAMLLKGRIFFEMDDLGNGNDCFIKVLNQNPTFKKYFNEIGYFSFLDDSSKREIALSLCDLYLEKFDSYEIKVWKSQLLFRLNLLDESLHCLNELLSEYKPDEDLFILKIQVLLNLKRYVEVIDLSEDYFKAYPNLVFIYNKAEALFALDNCQEAIDLCNFLLDSKDENYFNIAKFLVAKINYYNGMYEDALVEINNAIEFLDGVVATEESSYYEGCFIQYNYLKSLILYNLKEFDEANAICDCLIEKEPENAKNYCLKSMILFEEGKYGESLGLIQKTLELNPDCEDAIELKEKIETKMHNA